MFIEYRIESKGGAITVSQRVELGNATFTATDQPTPEVKPRPAAETKSQAGQTEVIDVPKHFNVAQPSLAPPGGGGQDPIGPGGAPGGSRGSGLVIVFGPVVVFPASGGPGAGGGGQDPIGPGGGAGIK